MIFRKGDKVEVMNKTEAAISWYTAVILSGNGSTYRVRYDFYCGLPGEQLVETISSKLVRPCPPLVQRVEHYVAGEIVEVFYESSWKISVILKVLGGKKGNKRSEIHIHDPSFHNQYLVRLLGCSKELIMERSDIRMRQTWHDGRWILLEKCCRGEDVRASKPLVLNCSENMNFKVRKCDGKAKNQPQKGFPENQDGTSLFKLPLISSRPRKRKQLYHSCTTTAVDGVQKLREVQKDGRQLRLVTAPELEKVDAVAYPKELLGEKNMHASFNIASIGYNQMERRKQKDVLDFCGIRSSEFNSSDSDACSVGSCSTTDRKKPNNYFSHLNSQFCQDTDTLGSDAESICSGAKRKRCSRPPKEEIEVNIRKLELHAYRCTLEVLYASGPLSWEQETLLTNLRIVLHISNDEHLKELKHLISAKTAVVV